MRAFTRRLLDAIPLLAVVLSLLVSAAGVVVGLLGQVAFAANLPQRNFWVEFRWVPEAQALAPDVATASRAGAPSARQAVEISSNRGTPPDGQSGPGGLNGRMLQVMNGARASLKLGSEVPVQWVQAAGASTGLAAGPASLPAQSPAWLQTGRALSLETTWLQAGQELSVLPRWSGAGQPVALEVRLEQARVNTPEATPGLPASVTPAGPGQGHLAHQTTVAAPLGNWVTLAISAASAPQTSSTWSTAAAAGGDATQRQILQVRVRLN
jgi:hypothetical protein